MGMRNDSNAPGSKPPVGKTARKIVSIVAFFVAFMAVKALLGHNAREDVLNRAAATADQKMQTLQTQAVQEHPDQALGDAMQQTVAKQAQSELSNKVGDAKADTAAGQFLGYYLVNIRARADYCKTQGVDISAFVEAFKRHNAVFYATSRTIHSRHGSPDELESTLYKHMRPAMERTIRVSMTDYATRNNASVADLCRGFAESPEEAAQELDLSRMIPAVAQALNEAS
ncbi:hypothetical protein AAB992_13595 [Burkholderia contaminans]|uniref:hypothetical protein n=1 Tax=Burkholderia contaminans TaxID=488447 RepID=UPI00241711DB|nr:hypothetical protein [Burkholderia contaminans]WFN11159.1 hypothetical protein LXE92_07395 [Burkholderia contaminans]